MEKLRKLYKLTMVNNQPIEIFELVNDILKTSSTTLPSNIKKVMEKIQKYLQREVDENDLCDYFGEGDELLTSLNTELYYYFNA
jgi:hypothetical protein